jgi:hypothetical protein
VPWVTVERIMAAASTPTRPRTACAAAASTVRSLHAERLFGFKSERAKSMCQKRFNVGTETLIRELKSTP